MEQLLRSVLIHWFTSVGVTSQSLNLFVISLNELMYDRRVALPVFLYPTNPSAVLLKNSLSFSGWTFSVFGLGLRIGCMTFHTSFLFCYIEPTINSKTVNLEQNFRFWFLENKIYDNIIKMPSDWVFLSISALQMLTSHNELLWYQSLKENSLFPSFFHKKILEILGL